MAVGYEIDRGRGLVTTTAWDSLNGAQVLEHQLQLRSDADFDPDFYQFIDFARVTEIEMDLETVVKLSNINLFSQKSHRAFFAGSNLLAYGMCRMFIAFHGAVGADQIQAFKDRDQAWQWLSKP
jgi:hypothetical protein